MEKSIKLVPFGLLIAYLAKSLITGAGLNEVLIIATLTGLTAFYEMKLTSKKTAELHSQIAELAKHSKEQDKIIDDIKSSIVSVKVSSGIRGLGR